MRTFCCSTWSGFVIISQALLLSASLISGILSSSSTVGNLSQGYEVNIRFEDGSADPMGIVEVAIGDEGPWVKVQTNRDWRAGSVVCRQLGHGPVLSTAVQHIEHIQDYYVILCQGHEESVKDCVIRTNTSSRFYEPFFLYVQCLPVLAQEFEIALIKKLHSLEEGVLFTFVNGRWGPVCTKDQNSSYFACAMVCRQLGYMGCNGRLRAPEVEILYEPVIPDLTCGAHAQSLDNCSYENTTVCPKDGSQFVEVVCHNWDLAGDGAHGGNSEGHLPSSSYSYLNNDPPESASNRYRPAMYLALVVAVSFCGMLLYLYRRNLAGTRRIFLDRTTNNAQSITLLPSGNVLSDGTMAFLPSGADSPPPPYDTVLMHQENGSSEGDNHQDDDPELPTYEEVVSTSPQVT